MPNKEIIIRTQFTPMIIQDMGNRLLAEIAIFKQNHGITNENKVNLPILNYIILGYLGIDNRFLSFKRKKSKYFYWYFKDKYLLMSMGNFSELISRLFISINRFNYQIKYGKEIYTQLLDKSLVLSEEIDRYNEIIPFNNGIYNLKSKEFIGPSPDHKFIRYFPVDFDESDDCPKFKAFMKQILPNELFRRQVLTYLAYCFTNRIDAHLAQIWTGAGDNGKTTLTQIIKGIMGDYATNVSMKKFTNESNKFAKAALKFSWLNIGSENMARKSKHYSNDVMKEIISNINLSGETKGKDEAQWVNTCKHIFEMNNLPFPSLMDDLSFYRRFQIIPFRFTIAEDKKIKNLHNILLNEEGPQIVSYIISHYQYIDKILIADKKKAEKMWLLNTHSAYIFFDEYCDIDPKNGWSKTNVVYNRYTDWCEKTKREPVVEKTFKTFLKVSLKVETQSEVDKLTKRIHWYYRMHCTRKGATMDEFLSCPIQEVKN